MLLSQRTYDEMYGNNKDENFFTQDVVNGQHKERPSNPKNGMRVVCAWCGVTKQEGNPLIGITHGICKVCACKEKAKYNNERGE